MRRTIFKGTGPYEQKGLGILGGEQVTGDPESLWLDGKKITQSRPYRFAVDRPGVAGPASRSAATDDAPPVRGGFVEAPDHTVHHVTQSGCQHVAQSGLHR